MTEPAPSPPPGSAPEVRQFDFWLGEWDVAWGEGKRGANRIEAILNGCVIQENFDGAPGTPLKGMSVSTYDARRKCWRQTWVDDAGNYWAFTGGFQDSRMTLATDDLTAEGKPIKLRMVWYNLAPDELDWNWEKSEDGGLTWTALWQLHYTRRTPREPTHV